MTEAAAVPAAATGTVRVPHCRVAGVIGKEIRFTLLMPDEWNHKFLMGGGGGFVGTVQNQAQSVVNAGYATVGTDTGHQGSITKADWALNNPERQENFGHLAVHRTAEVAKAIIRSYYGSNETRSYFSGCSNGGRQALMEAQRYPADFDGIVAGAPAADFTAIGAQFIKDMRAAFPDPSNLATAPFSPEALKSIETQIVDKCDALDGVKDGLMDDPRMCKVDVAALTGVTDAQRAMLKAIYAETRNKDGVIYPAQPVGGEGEAAGWQAWITGLSPMLMTAQKAPSIALCLRHGDVQVLRVRRPVVRLHALRPVDVQERHGARGGDPQRDRSEPRRVQEAGRQAAAVARLVRSGAHRARQHQVLRAGEGARSRRPATTSGCS